jgi:hypothetical protein
LFWSVEGGRAFGIVDIVVVGVGIAEVELNESRNKVVVAAGNMDSGLAELVVRTDSRIDFVVEEEAVVEEDIQIADERS